MALGNPKHVFILRNVTIRWFESLFPNSGVTGTAT